MGWKSVVLLIVTVCAVVRSATVLDGYLRLVAGGNCFADLGGDALAMVSLGTGVEDDCTKVTVTGDSTAGYVIAQSSDATKQFTLADLNDATPLTVSATGTALKFVMTDDTAVCGAGLNDDMVGFLIDDNNGAETGSDCLLTDLTYKDTSTPETCSGQLFYFDTVACSGITDCELCYDDGGTLKCSACRNNKKPDSAKTACEACTTNTIVDSCGIECTACSATQVPNSDHNTCEDCIGDKVQDSVGTTCTDCDLAMSGCTACTAHDACTACTADTLALKTDNSGCIACSTAIPSCSTCSSTAGSNTCTLCSGTTVLNTAGDECITCGAAMADCTTCSAHDVCTACENDKVPNEAQDMCITCAELITDCETCALDAATQLECSSCGKEKILSDNQCQSCTAPEEPNEAGTACEDTSGSGVIAPMHIGIGILMVAIGKIMA